GGGLEVRVLRDGKPLAKAAVKLDRAGGAQLYSPAYVGSDRGPERGRAEALLSPVTRTDVKGVARFRHLVPGSYKVTAGDGGEDAVRADAWLRGWIGKRDGKELSLAVCEGVPVRSGETSRFDVAVYPQHNLL